MNAEHRAKWELLRQAASFTYPDFHGEWAYDEWASHNERYFNGALLAGPITWGLTPYGKTIGYYAPWVNRIHLHYRMIRGMERPTRFASDVLLHEMIHQRINQCHPDTDSGRDLGTSSHNNPLWVAEVNRIAPLLGLPANAEQIKQRRIDGKVCWYEPDEYMTRVELGAWPYYARPAGYYEIDPAAEFGDNFQL